LPLDLVAEVVANGGTLPEIENLNKSKGWLTRKNGLKLSALWFVTVVMLLLPLAGISRAPEEVTGSLAILGFFGTLLGILVSLFFLPKAVKPAYVPAPGAETSEQRFFGGGKARQALPSQQSIPVSNYTAPAPGNWRDTNDLEPASVTERSTRMLGDRERG
jgi:hypothetical protein